MLTGKHYQIAWQFWIGLLLADACIMFPWYWFSMFACSPFVGGSFRTEQFHAMISGAVTALGALTLLVVCCAYWLRWLFYLILVPMFFGSLYLVPMLVDCIGKRNGEAVLVAIFAFIGLVLDPLSMWWLATGVRRRE